MCERTQRYTKKVAATAREKVKIVGRFDVRIEPASVKTLVKTVATVDVAYIVLFSS